MEIDLDNHPWRFEFSKSKSQTDHMVLQLVDMVELKEKDVLIKSYTDIVEVNNRKLKSQKKQVESILTSLNEGLVVLDNKLRVKSLYSNQAKEILSIQEIENKNILDLFFPNDREGSELARKMEDSLSMMFALFVPDQFKNVIKTAVDSLKYRINDDTYKLLHLSYSPIIVDDEIKNIIITFSDNTELDKLRNSIRYMNQKVLESFSRIGGLLSKNSSRSAVRNTLLEFLPITDNIILMLDELKKENINELFRAIHTIKGGAGNFRIDFIHSFAHEAENIIESVRRGHVQLSALDIGELKEMLLNLRSGITSLNQIWSFIDTEVKTESENDEWNHYLDNLGDSVKSIGTKLNKKVELDISKPNVILQGKDFSFFQKIIFHLIHNSID